MVNKVDNIWGEREPSSTMQQAQATEAALGRVRETERERGAWGPYYQTDR